MNGQKSLGAIGCILNFTSSIECDGQDITFSDVASLERYRANLQKINNPAYKCLRCRNVLKRLRLRDLSAVWPWNGGKNIRKSAEARSSRFRKRSLADREDVREPKGSAIDA
jgi:hypothetical protein